MLCDRLIHEMHCYRLNYGGPERQPRGPCFLKCLCVFSSVVISEMSCFVSRFVCCVTVFNKMLCIQTVCVLLNFVFS